MSLGDTRIMKIEKKGIELNQGDIIFLYNESHGIVKEEKNVKERISLNLF